MPRHTSNARYPLVTKEDKLQAILIAAQHAVHDSIEYSNSPSKGWTKICREDALSAAQKAMYTLNVELAPLLMARDNLEMAIITLSNTEKEIATWGNTEDA